MTPIPELTLYLIRHAESTGNADPDKPDVPFDEHHDPWLTEKGKTQARLLGKALADIDFDAVYSSPMRRTVSTAKGLLEHQPTEKTLFLMPILSERGIPYDYEGQPLSELLKIYPASRLAEGFTEDMPRLANDKGQPDPVILERAATVLGYFRSRYKNGERVAVVSHAAFLTYVIFYLFGVREQMPDFDIDITNTGVTKVTFFREGTNPYGDTVFAYINNAFHLFSEGRFE